MSKGQLIGLLIAGLILMAASVLLRARYGDRYGVTTIDLVLLFVPLLVALLLAGKLKEFEAFGVKANLTEVFADAAATSIEGQVSAVPSPDVGELVSSLEMGMRGGVRDIPELIAKGTQALVFRLGHGGYYGPVIETYLKQLSASPDFRYLIVQDRKGRFFGMYELSALRGWFREEGDRAFEAFADWLNRGDDEGQKALARLPGFIGAEQAISKATSKREALRKMDELTVDRLPVVDGAGAFAGTVERSQLTASLILDVLDRMEGSGKR
jgi:hypothetical protein